MTEKQMINKNNGSVDKIAQPAVLRRYAPAVDIYETDDDLVLIADLPGVEESNLQLEISRGVLTLEAAITNSGTEQQHTYHRQFKISDRIDSDSGEAALKDGVLTLRLPKAEAAKPKKIAVKTLH